jgi:arylsulfatase A
VQKLTLFILTLVGGSCFSRGQAVPLPDVAQPNIVIIFNDDLGYQDLGCFGSPNILTPNIDRLAREGLRLTDFYVASPVCSASRAALLTGRYPGLVGIKGVLHPNQKNGLDPVHVTIAESLKAAGYATAIVGKWHLGDKPEYLPTRQGFDSYYGIPYSNDMYPAKDMNYAEDCLFREGFSLALLKERFALLKNNEQPKDMKNKVPLMRNEACIEFPVDQTTITRRYADESIRFITDSVKARKPFLLYLANSMPHTPLFTEERFRGKSKRGLYGDAVEEIDFHAGRILALLKELGVEKNTIVIFTSDNGPWLGKGKDGGTALPLFEGKFTCFEGGQRVPFVIRWPARIPAGSVSAEVATSMDLFPTLANVAGAKLPEVKLDGINILPLWTDPQTAKSPHEYFFYVYNDGEAVRWRDWKYHERELYQFKPTARDSTGPALYNLRNDIGEATNVMADHPEVAQRLAAVLQEHLARYKNISTKTLE